MRHRLLVAKVGGLYKTSPSLTNLYRTLLIPLLKSDHCAGNENHCRGCRAVSISMRIEERVMNLGNLFHRFVAPMLALGVAGAILLLASQFASAQEITATTPFSFSVDNQQYPAGTYQFTLIPEGLLSIRNADGKKNIFPIRPEGRGPFGSNARLTFYKGKGHNELLAVYIPGTDMTAELLGKKGFKR
jgi:hypothetical protein